MQKVIKVKVKTSLYYFTRFWKIDQYIVYDKQLIKNNKDSIYKSFIRDLKTKISKKLKISISQHLLVKSLNKMYKKKEKKLLKLWPILPRLTVLRKLYLGYGNQCFRA